MRTSQPFENLAETLKLAVATLREADISFMLGGSLAAWARGGPEPQNDLDLMVKPRDADAALRALSDVGMRPERPPEEWLYKAWHEDVMVDVIFYPSGLDVTEEVLARADTIAVLAVATPVMAIEDMLITMLLSLGEHRLDYSRLLLIARSLREQIDWSSLRTRCAGSPYAQAFFTLVEELGVAPSQPGSGRTGQSKVRVLPAAGQRGTTA